MICLALTADLKSTTLISILNSQISRRLGLIDDYNIIIGLVRDILLVVLLYDVVGDRYQR